MLYKTIVLELLEQRPELYERLRTTRTLMATLDRLANDLKTSHEAWRETLSQANPGARSDPSQIASEAGEMAIQELESRLRDSTLPADDPGAP